MHLLFFVHGKYFFKKIPLLGANELQMLIMLLTARKLSYRISSARNNQNFITCTSHSACHSSVLARVQLLTVLTISGKAASVVRCAMQNKGALSYTQLSNDGFALCLEKSHFWQSPFAVNIDRSTIELEWLLARQQMKRPHILSKAKKGIGREGKGKEWKAIEKSERMIFQPGSN